ncbi:AarF/UbiB family protein [Trinickia sp. LjRoot230]|uniref:ABC1 kinase family protein n=1 Tax=Trinickia sp. LjRoot230 TaxID=3342288 RepID=UPI003ECF3112
MRTTLRRLLLLFCALRYGATLLWTAAPEGEKLRGIATLLARMHRDRGARAALHRALPQLGPLASAFVEEFATHPGRGLRTLHDALEKLARERTALSTPLSPQQAESALRAAIGHPLEDAFESIDWMPLESGIAEQTHAARLRAMDDLQGSPSKMDVIVKLLRVRQVQRIEDDVAVLRWLARLLERWFSAARTLGLRALADIYALEVTRRFDLRMEAANLSQTGRHFAADTRLAVPEVNWALTTDKALVVERIDTLPATDIDGLRRHGVDLERLAAHIVEVVIDQAFEHGFFHAALSARHLRVSIEPQTSGRIVLADCAVMSTLTEPEREFFVHGATALFKRDYGRLARMHHEVGHVAPHTRPEQLEAELRTRGEAHFAWPAAERMATGLLRHLVDAVEPFGGRMPPALVLAGHSLARAESLARMLAPALDTWQIAETSLAALARKDVDHRGWLKRISRELPHLAPIAPRLPLLVVQALQRLEPRRTTLDVVAWVAQFRREQQRTRRLLWACAALGVLLGGALTWLAR